MRHVTVFGVLAVLCLLMTVAAVVSSSPAPLFSEQLRLSEEQWKQFLKLRGSRGKILNGPKLVFLQPEIRDNEARVASTSVGWVIELQENKAPVDPASLRVVALPLVFVMDITDRLNPRFEGDRLYFDEAAVGNASYLLEISIADVQGNLTEYGFILHVGDDAAA